MIRQMTTLEITAYLKEYLREGKIFLIEYKIADGIENFQSKVSIISYGTNRKTPVMVVFENGEIINRSLKLPLWERLTGGERITWVEVVE